jgi:hypothetical protein
MLSYPAGPASWLSTVRHESYATAMVEKDGSGGGEECELPVRGRRGALDERAGLIFWAALLSLVASLTGAVAASALHVDATQIEAGLVGAFLGSSPVVLLPALSRLALGRDSVFIDRARLPFRLLTVLWGCLVVCSRLLHWWPRHNAHTSAVSRSGVLSRRSSPRGSGRTFRLPRGSGSDSSSHRHERDDGSCLHAVARRPQHE